MMKRNRMPAQPTTWSRERHSSKQRFGDSSSTIPTLTLNHPSPFTKSKSFLTKGSCVLRWWRCGKGIKTSSFCGALTCQGSKNAIHISVFIIRSDPWAGLIASCGSFYPMIRAPNKIAIKRLKETSAAECFSWNGGTVHTIPQPSQCLIKRGDGEEDGWKETSGWLTSQIMDSSTDLESHACSTNNMIKRAPFIQTKVWRQL